MNKKHYYSTFHRKRNPSYKKKYKLGTPLQRCIIREHYINCNLNNLPLKLKDLAIKMQISYSMIRMIASTIDGITDPNRVKQEDILYRYKEDIKTGCWLWQFSTSGNGTQYGNYYGKPAHKVMYERTYGKVEEGYELDHLCNNSLCINPNHLEPVTPKVNNNRKYGRMQTKLFNIIDFKLLTRASQKEKRNS